MTRNMIRPACKVLPLLSAILPPPTCAVMTGTPAGAVAPAAPAPTTAVAAKVAAVTAATPSANDFLPIIDTPPYGSVGCPPARAQAAVGLRAIQGAKAATINPPRGMFDRKLQMAALTCRTKDPE